MRQVSKDINDQNGVSVPSDAGQTGFGRSQNPSQSFDGRNDARPPCQRSGSNCSVKVTPRICSKIGSCTPAGVPPPKQEKKGIEGAPVLRRRTDLHHQQPAKQNGIFVDAGAMKEKMRMQLSKPEYNVANFYHAEGIFQAVARHPWFDRASLLVITFNAVWISIDTDLNDAETIAEAQWPFFVADNFFCTFFVVEWLVRFMAFRHKRDGLRDAWFVFDMVLVIMMVLETWVLTIVFLLAGGGGGGAGNAGVLKLIRLSRLSRMARMARLLRAMPELLVLLKGMWAATRSVFFTLFLLFIILYIFGIAFKQLASDTSVGDAHFHTVPSAMHTLLLRGTLMDEMTGIVDEMLSDNEYILLATFYTFVLMSALTVMNMLIGVLCEVVAAVAATEKEEASVAYVKWRIRDVMKNGGLDLDGDGRISKEEFCKILDDPQATRTLSNAGVDVFGLVDCADFIFGEGSPFSTSSSAEDDGEIFLSFSDFMEVVLQLRGTNVATVKDLVDLRKFLTITTGRIEAKLEQVDAVLEEICGIGSTRLAQFPLDIASCQDALQTNEGRSSSKPVRLDADEELNILQGPLDSASASQERSKAAGTAIPYRGHTIDDYGPLDHICAELDQLRNYVDAELSVIMRDLTSRSASLPHRNANGPTAQKPDMEASSQNCLRSERATAYEDFTSESANHVRSQSPAQDQRHFASWERSSLMCPGAELRKPMSCGL